MFIKELVPKRLITFVANTIYKEKYATHAMKHVWNHSDTLQIEYHWKVKGHWNHIKAIAEKEPSAIITNSEEEFITEHYWGYTFIDNSCTGVYEVVHPKWRVHKVLNYDIRCSVENLYGSEFSSALAQTPRSVFLAEGSPIEVMKGNRLIKRAG